MLMKGQRVVRKHLFSPLFPFLQVLFFFCLFLFSFLFFSLKKESPDGCKAKNHKYWVPSFGEFYVLSSMKS